MAYIVYLETNNGDRLPAVYLRVDMRSLFGGSLGFGVNLAKLAPVKIELACSQIAEYKQLRWLLNKDYYPLSGIRSQLDDTALVGRQFHDPESGEGFFVVIRPDRSSYRSAEIKLRGLLSGTRYEVSAIGEHVSKMARSEILVNGWRIDLALPDDSKVYKYALEVRRQ